MKRISIFGCIAAALLSFTGCEQSGNDGYDGTNYIYLESAGGKTTIWEQDETPLTMTVTLTTSLSEDLSLTFAIEGTTEGVLELQDNPVTIEAGEKTATFEIVSKNADLVASSENFKISLDASTVLPEKVRLKSDFYLVVRSASVSALTEDQKAIIQSYKESTGLDLSKFIGAVNVTTVISGLDAATYESFENTVTDKTLITLSETSTAEAPVLKMLVNPMGIQDYMYSVMRCVTVEDAEQLWFPEEYPMECYSILTETIGWNTESVETFSVSLDGITFGAEKEITFAKDYINSYEEESVIVPFEFSFTAFEREKLADFSSATVKPGDDEWMPDCTADPVAHLNVSGISYDEYEMEGEGYYVEPSAEIDADGNLVFTFCYDHKNASDYTRVVATYTPNN